ncbi:MAG: uracil-DNA glycosylase, partial [Phycisphaeraceae bacterium]
MTPNTRQIKQLLAIDQLLGMESVPVKKVESRKAEVGSSRPTTPAAPLSTSHFPLPTSDFSSASLAQLDADYVSVCTRCPLHKTRHRTVFGEGDPNATILFVGEGPGADEDAQGRPFVGRAGQLLDKQIAAMGLERNQVYIANIVKCRPPDNRVPTPEEAATCQPYLDQQVALIQPKVIVALGATAAKYLLNDPKLAITRERGNWREYRNIKL